MRNEGNVENGQRNSRQTEEVMDEIKSSKMWTCSNLSNFPFMAWLYAIEATERLFECFYGRSSSFPCPCKMSGDDRACVCRSNGGATD